jgi:hypothetical protein
MIQATFTFEEWCNLIKNLNTLHSLTKEKPNSLIDLLKKVDKIRFEGETIIIGKNNK